MKALLTITALLEVTAGLAIVTVPSQATFMLLGNPLETAAAQAVARIAGTALLSLAVVCWMARCDTGSRAARGIGAGMLLYNSGVVAVLAFGIAIGGLRGLGLWPAMLVHSGMAAWCGVCLVQVTSKCGKVDAGAG